jgi:hypothetical protein
MAEKQRPGLPLKEKYILILNRGNNYRKRILAKIEILSFEG